MSTQSDPKIILLIKTPKTVDESLEKFDSFFSDFHKLVEGTKGISLREKTVSFELLFKEGHFFYRIILAKKLAAVVKSLLYTKFTDVEVSQKASIEKISGQHATIAEFGLKRSNYFPLKTRFKTADDPYKIFAAILSKLEHFNEGIILQLVVEAVCESWLTKYLREHFYFIVGAINSVRLFLEKPFLERDYFDQYAVVKEKFEDSLFLANVRVVTYAPDRNELRENFNLMHRALDKFKNGDINEFQRKNINQKKLIQSFTDRKLSPKTMKLNTKEVSAIFHFPDKTSKISEVFQVSSKKVKPPKELPIAKFLKDPDVSVFGKTNYRDRELEFGILKQDRNRHLYIIGKTGMGKSKMIQLLAISDIQTGKGVCVIDPHGDLAIEILKFVPKRRIKDVIYFNPLDAQYTVGFNPLQCFSPESKHQVVEGFIAIFEKLFAATWTNRLEHMLRYTVLALVEAGDATVVDIVKLLTDVEFRQGVIKKIKDPVVKNFWTHEFASWNEKFDNEAIIPIINQVGQFIANDYIRNVVDQKESGFDFHTAMNEGKIVIINIAKGILGEENTALLGSMIVTKIQEATMARVTIPESQRKEFYLYVDEFQHFATESFNQIMSEARKFNLSLTIAHQYIDQLSESIAHTVFGNVGSIICFRVGPDDAQYLKNEFSPHIGPDDLINLDFREAYAKLSINGKTSEPFSGLTIDTPESEEDYTNEIIEFTRKTYAKQKKVKISPTPVEERVEGELVLDQKEEREFEDMEFEEPII